MPSVTSDTLARLEALGANGPGPNLGLPAVTWSRDLTRVRGLARTNSSDATAMFEDLRKPGCTMSLRPIQEQALLQATLRDGLLALMPTGSGKTLVAALLPTVMYADRALILTKPALVAQTRRMLDAYRAEWDIREGIEVRAYSILSSIKSGTGLLEALAPDLIIADEAHCLKNPKAARTRRLTRYLRANPETRFCALSGTLLSGSLMDIGHLGAWALDEASPLPLHWPVLAQWAQALDPGAQRPTGALQAFRDDFGGTSVRDAYRRRFVSCPGVTAGTAMSTDIPLVFEHVAVPPVAQAEKRLLRQKWELPDGTLLMRAVDYSRNDSAMDLGFFYRWQWPGGQEDYDWMEAHRALGRWVQAFLRTRARDGLDSPGLVVRALESGTLTCGPYTQWTRVDSVGRGPTPVVEWIRDEVQPVVGAIRRAWPEGLILCHAPEFGRRLAEAYGVSYGQVGGPVCVGSLASMGTGRDDLTDYDRLLVISPSPSPDVWEQAIGRVHRPGQRSRQVTVGYVYADGFDRAAEKARHVQELTGLPQKMLA